jgi:hypothetical protein
MRCLDEVLVGDAVDFIKIFVESIHQVLQHQV